MIEVTFSNGPKSSGKDFTTEHLVEMDDLPSTNKKSTSLKFAKPLYDGLVAIFGLEEKEWEYVYNNHKDEPYDKLFGLTPRAAMIWLSEDALKPKFGKNVMGKLSVNQLKLLVDQGYERVHYSDSGFKEEAIEVVSEVGADKCYLLRIEADGCTFDGDSRSYIEPEDIGLNRETNYQVVYNCKTSDYVEVLGEVSYDIGEIL